MMNISLSIRDRFLRIFDGRLSYYILVVFLASLVGVVIAFGVFSFTQTLFIGIIVFSLFIIFNRPASICYLLMILMFIPLSLGTVLRLRIIWLAEPVILILFLLVFLKNITARDRSGVFTIKTNPFIIPLVLYVGVLFFNYLRFPLPASSVVGVAQEMGGIRYYYDKLIMFLVFFPIAYLVETERPFSKNISRLMLFMTVIITFVGMLTVFIDPFYQLIVHLQESGVFASDTVLSGLWAKVTDPYTGAVRSYILWIAPFGILLLMSDIVQLKPVPRITLLGFLSFGLVLSATRNFVLGTLLALVVWALLAKKKRLLFAFSIVAIVLYLIPSIGFLSKPINRLIYFSSDMERLTSFRYDLFTTYWEMFQKNILFGVGVGATEIGGQMPGTPEYFFMQNLRFGGHGFFLGTLYTQGIVGLIPFLLICFIVFRMSMRLFRVQNNVYYKKIGLFGLIFIVYSIIPFIVGGAETYNQFFIVAAIISGTYTHFLKKTGSHA
jgi:hypothetical protein